MRTHTDVDKLMKQDYANWPEEIQYVFNRAMAENGWDGPTAYVMLMLGQIPMPRIRIHVEALNPSTAKIPFRKEIVF